jgi:hypothetical protein
MNTPRLRWEKWNQFGYMSAVCHDVHYTIGPPFRGTGYGVVFGASTLGQPPTLKKAKALAQAHFDALCGAIEKMKEDK